MEGAGGRQGEELEEDDPDLASALAASLEEPLIQLSGSLVTSARRSSEDDLQEALRRSLLESGSEPEQEGQEKQVEKREEKQEAIGGSSSSSSGARAVSLTVAETELATEATASPSVFHDAREELSPGSGLEPEKTKMSGITEEGAGGGADVHGTPTREPVPSVDDFDSMCSEEEPSLKQRLSQTILIEDSPAAAGASDTVPIDDSFGVAGSSAVLIEDSPAPSRTAAEAAEDERARRKAAALEDSFEEQEPRCRTPEEEYAPEETDSEGEGGSKQVMFNSPSLPYLLPLLQADSTWVPTSSSLKNDSHSFLFPEAPDSSDSESEVSSTVVPKAAARAARGQAREVPEGGGGPTLDPEERTRRMQGVFESGLAIHLSGEEMEGCRAVSRQLFPHQRVALAWLARSATRP